MHVTVQQRRGLERGDQAGQRPEPAVRRVVTVADAAWRRVGEQHVDPAAVPLPAPPRPASQRPGAPGLLPVGVLVGPVAVAPAPAEPGQAQAGHVDDPAVGVDGAVRPGRPGGQAGPERQAGPGRAVPGDVRVMITGHEDERDVQHVHQRAQVLERQVTAGQDQLGAAHRGRVSHQRVIDLIGDREDTDHTTIIGRGGHDAGLPREFASVRGRFPRLLADIEATLPQRRFHPVDLGLRSAVAAQRRADIQPPAGRRQRVRVGAAQRLHPMVLSGQAGPGFGVLKLRAQPTQVGLEPLDRLGRQGLETGLAAGLAEPPGQAPRADERESPRPWAAR